MDRIIEEVRNAGHGFRTHKAISVFCYADDALLISESEDDLQRMIYQFYLTSARYNMAISVQKTKSLVVAKNPIRCKLAVNDQIIEQVMTFKYLGDLLPGPKSRSFAPDKESGKNGEVSAKPDLEQQTHEARRKSPDL